MGARVRVERGWNEMIFFNSLLLFYLFFWRSIIWTWRSAFGFHNNPAYWMTAGSTNPQLSAFQGLLMELRIPVRQAAHCWHVPGGLVGGCRQWAVELCGETAAICPPVTSGQCSHSGGSEHLLKLQKLPLLLQAAQSRHGSGGCFFSPTSKATHLE